jgi:hypothetical protein
MILMRGKVLRRLSKGKVRAWAKSMKYIDDCLLNNFDINEKRGRVKLGRQKMGANNLYHSVVYDINIFVFL